MKKSVCQAAPRREFLKNAAGATAAAVLAGTVVPRVHAAEDNTIRLALIGCGGRGSGAVGNALSVPGENVKLVAMADVFEDKLNISHKSLSKQFADRIDVPAERQFIGFDAYRKAIDCLRPGDVALLTTHAAFRPTHLEYAVEKGVHVFMEKNFAPDPAGLKQILRAGEAAERKNLKIAAGLMCRHSTARQALIEKIRGGELGEVLLTRAYRMGGGAAMSPFPKNENELLWQIRRAYHFLWASAGYFLEMMIHQIDECCWIKDAWPTAAHGVGGRCADSTDCSRNLDSYSIEYMFPDGSQALVTGRYLPNCFNDFATYVQGSKRAAQFSGNVHAPTVQIYKDRRVANDNIAWKPESEKVNPWQAEWNVLLEAIRNDRPHNESRRAAMANYAALMGRAAVHSGKIVTWDQITESNFSFCPNVAELTADSPAPVRADANGRYSAPVPGKWTEV
ncbi:MAG: Gfo/Idh/MocA family oxidoreductase [Pirellulaceae bacterium]|nr:Gfo/Idh/MocA family oxidoreductase [Pirellulaceae bacterium]